MENVENDVNEYLLIVNREYKEWTMNATKLLIDLYKENKQKVGTWEIKKMKQLWQKISEEMLNQNFNYSPSNCENKWKVLERNFKKFIDNQSKTGRGKKYFEFYEDMKDLYERKRNVFPQTLLTASTEIPSTSKEIPILAPERTDDIKDMPEAEAIPPTEAPAKLCRKRKRAQQIQRRDILENFNSNLKNYHQVKTEYYQFKKRYYEGKENRENEMLNTMKSISTTLKEIYEAHTK